MTGELRVLHGSSYYELCRLQTEAFNVVDFHTELYLECSQFVAFWSRGFSATGQPVLQFGFLDRLLCGDVIT